MIAGLRRLVHRLPLGATGTSAVVLTVGTALGHVFTIVSMSVLGRTYTQAELAPMISVQAYAGLLGSVVLMRYDAAVPLAEDDAEARGLVRLATTLSALWCCLLAVGVAVAWASGALNDQTHLGASVWAVAPLSLCFALIAVGRQYLARVGAFGRVSLASVLGVMTQALTHIVAGAMQASVVVLSWLLVVGRSVNLIAQRARRPAGPPPVAMATVARRWSRMPQWGIVPVILSGLSVMAVAPVIGWLFGRDAVASYGFTFALLSAPMALLSQAVSGVFTPYIARVEREGGDAGAAMTRLFRALGWVSLAVFTCAMLLGREAILLILGPRWEEAGYMAMLIAPWLMINFVSSPLSIYGTVQNRLERLFVVNVVESVLRFVGLGLGLVLSHVLWGIAGYSLAGVLICGYSCWWTLSLAGVPLQQAIAPLLPATGFAFVAVAAVSFTRWWGWSTPAVMTLAGVFAVALVAWCARRFAILVVVTRATAR